MIDIDEATKKYEPKKENDSNTAGDTSGGAMGGAKGSSVYMPQYD